MMNHIAVILRGHHRTWNLICDYTLSSYDKLAKQVDYYVVSWDIPYTGTKHITDTFEGRNLVKYYRIPIIETYYNSYYSSCWLPYNILPWKRLREKTVNYDAVIDSRPDIAVKVYQDRPIIKPEENCLYATKVELHENIFTHKKDIALSDWFFVSTSNVYNIMAQRFIFPDFAGTQITQRLYAEKEGINVCTIDYIDTFIARPNIFNLELNDNTFKDIGVKSREWVNLDREQRRQYAKAANVREEDYNTLSLHAAI
jgi:hypothetical protein